jgi:alkanesulfonate monooxygenase SsuD/methylene tetrahydromethanopterin reductase-like flavin-dependent oxidoreductase (luciferase family)
VAEELAMLDNRARGRSIAGFVRGIPREYLALSIPLREGRPRFEEALDVIIKAWTNDLLNHDGEYYHYKDVDMWPRPYQDPHPPIWVGAIGPEPTRNVARRRGVTLCSTFQPTASIKKQLQLFRDACAEFGRPCTPNDILIARHVFCGDSQKEAEQLCKTHFEYYFQQLLGKVNNAAIQRILDMNPDLTFDSVKTPYPYDVTPMEKMRDDGFVLVGTPDRVYQDLMAQYEEYGGFGTFMAIVRMGAMPQELVLNNVRLFGKEVIPRLHAVEAKAA